MNEGREGGRVAEAPQAVLPFSREMIRSYLDRAKLTYRRDKREDFRVDLEHDKDLRCAPSFWLTASGAEEEIYGIEARSNRRFPRDMWDWCLYVVNEWNKRMRYPKAYLYVPDPESGVTGEIRLEEYTDLEYGTHQEFVDHLTATIMGGAVRFWAWLDEQALEFALISASDDQMDA